MVSKSKDTTTRYEMTMQNKILNQFEGNLELIGVSAEKTRPNEGTLKQIGQ
jgi:hypothetical protein